MSREDWFDARERSAESFRKAREEDDSEIIEKARRWDVVRGLRAQRDQALGFARMYLAEDGPGGARERACLDVVAGLNLRIREMNLLLMGRS